MTAAADDMETAGPPPPEALAGAFRRALAPAPLRFPLPCPLCGDPAEAADLREEGGPCLVGCAAAGHSVVAEGPTPAEALARWNRRP